LGKVNVMIKNSIKRITPLRRSVELFQKWFPYAFKPSQEFYKWFRFVEESQWWSPEQIENYRLEKIKDIVSHCYQHVPFYRRTFRSIGFQPGDVKSIADFQQLPFLTREMVREHYEELIPDNVDRKAIEAYNTGGSTGLPLKIYRTRLDTLIEDAFMTSQWARIGYRPKDSRVILRGEALAEDQLWKYYPSGNLWVFSSYHLKNEYVHQMVGKINRIKPLFLHVYPSSLWVFTNLMKEQKLRFTFKLKGILCGSEQLFDFQRELFESFFETRCFSWLGLAEQTTLAGECEHSNHLHAFPQHSYVELVNSSNYIINEPDSIGEIVGTTLHKYVFPLIRYKSGDLASYASNKCACSRNFPLFEKVQGRTQNVLIGKDRRIFPVTALFFGQHLEAFDKIKSMQLEQFPDGDVVVRVSPIKDFNFEDQNKLLLGLKKATNNSINFSCDVVEAINRTKAGKHKLLIQHLKVDLYDFEQPH
jgi:phenylacetate-CoA ligase